MSATLNTNVVYDYVWLVNANGSVDKLDLTGTAVTGAVGIAGTASTRGGVAFDSTGDVWSVTSANNILNFVVTAGTGATAYSGGGLSTPVFVAVDGAGMIWAANSGNDSVSEFTNAGVAQSGTSGYGSSTLSGPSQVNIDNTGGVWVSNKTGSSLTHIFGAATPVISPTAAAVTNGTTGQKP